VARERDATAVVLGGGPAGSAAAALLAEAGVETLLIDDGRPAAVHAGASLVPHALPLLDRLGVHDAVRALQGTLVKEGATFLTHEGARRVSYRYADALPPALPHAYHVPREELSAVLLANARARGAEVLSGWRAVSPLWDGGRLIGIAARDAGNAEVVLRPRVLLDASGRQSFLADRMGWRFPYPRHRKLALCSRWRGVRLAAGREAGNVEVVLTRAGWFRLLPFADGTASVECVLDERRWGAEGASPEGMFAAAVARTPEIAARLAGAERIGGVAAVRDFSYRVMRTAGDGFCLLGDAAGFLDPIFSTGVLVALATGASAADDAIDALRRHRRVEANDFAPTVALTRTLHRSVFSFIRAFYNPHFLAFFFGPHPTLGVSAAVVSLLAGDVVRPGRLLRTGRYRVLLAAAILQRVGLRWGRPLVPPLAETPGGVAA
jgi:flavin-dependent dehydrogenase